MDGFRDRLRERSAERYDRESRESRYDDRDRASDRYDRESRYDDRYDSRRRSSYDSSDNVADVVDSSNAKQLREIKELFLDAKDDRYTSEKQIIRAVSELEDKVADKVAGKVVENLPKAPAAPAAVEMPVVDNTLNEQIIANTNAIMTANNQILENTNALLTASVSPQPVAAAADNSEVTELARENNSILMQLAEEQLSMLIRGNSSMLSQISQSSESNEELLRSILNSVNNMSTGAQAPMAMDPMMAMPVQGNEELLQIANQNNTLLNTLRSEVAAFQGELRDASMQRDMMQTPVDPYATEEPLAPLDGNETTDEKSVDFDEKFSAVNENIHKECVKVYRNVQALMEEQSRAIDKSVKSGVTPVKVMVIITLILSLLSFASNIVFNILPNLGL